MKSLHWCWPLPLVMLGTASALAEDGKLSRAEVAKRSKPAVAFVLAQTNQRGVTSQGTAFCIHPSGLFITNAHETSGVWNGLCERRERQRAEG